jgi:hypothetical protein
MIYIINLMIEIIIMQYCKRLVNGVHIGQFVNKIKFQNIHPHIKYFLSSDVGVKKSIFLTKN